MTQAEQAAKELKEMPTPIGNYILSHICTMEPLQGVNGKYWHYVDIITMIFNAELRGYARGQQEQDKEVIKELVDLLSKIADYHDKAFNWGTRSPCPDIDQELIDKAKQLINKYSHL